MRAALGSPVGFGSRLGAWSRRARVRHWAHFLALPLAGFHRAAPWSEATLSLARGIATAFAVLAFGYLLNALADRDMDDAEKNTFVGESVERPYRFVIALAALAMALSALGPPLAVAATAGCLVSGWVYSIGPRLKAYPLVGTLLNVTNFAPLLFVGVSRAGFPASGSRLTLAFVALLLQNQLLHEAADRDEDARGRVTTTVRVLGPVASALAAAVIATAVPMMFALAGQRVAAAVAGLLFVVSFPTWLAVHAGDPTAMRRSRLAHRIASLVTGALLFASAYAISK